MHLLQYALLATFYSIGVSAFYPYAIGSAASSTDSKLGFNGKLMNRFFPFLRWLPPKENDSKEYRTPTLKLRKVPRLVRRTYLFHVIFISRSPFNI